MKIAADRSWFHLGQAGLTFLLVGIGFWVSEKSASAQSDPLVFDLRDAGPGGDSWVPAIQDQSNLGDCWSFATTTALDSDLIMNGYLPTSTTPPAMSISSWHLSAYNGAPENTISGGGAYNGIVGGDVWMTTSYYTRGQGSWPIPGASTGPSDISQMGGGIILNSNNPNNPFPLAAVQNDDNLASKLPPVSQAPGFTLTGAYYFDQYDQSGTAVRTVAQQEAAVKGALQQFGALATYMYAGGYTLNGHDDSVFHFSNTDGLGYTYEYDPSNNAAEHVVTIIGWDDNIVIPEPTLANPTATETGAWIVQNSWGAWGGTTTVNDGTFYAPYNDPFIGVQGVTAFTAVPAGKYSPYVLQNELGPTYEGGNWGSDTHPNTVGNVPTGFGILPTSRVDIPSLITLTGSSSIAVSNLTITSPQTLLALGLESVDAQVGASKPVMVSLYGGFNASGSLTSAFGTLLQTDTFTFPQEGYTVFDLSTPLLLTSGEILTVEVDYEGSELPYVWQSSAQGNGITDAPTGLSYFYDATTDEWQDFADFTGVDWYNDKYAGVFSVKGLVAVPEPTMSGALMALMGILFFVGRRLQQNKQRCG